MTVSAGPPLSRTERQRRRRRAQLVRWGVRVAAAAVLLALGIAIGRALDDAPEPGSPFTRVRTLPPLEPEPATQPAGTTT